MFSHLYTKSSLYKSKLKHSSDEGLSDPKLLENDNDISKEPKEKVESINNSTLSIWMCPKCRSGLYLSDGVWSCENKHSFDQARQGYTNLLLANKKGSSNPGDSREMIDARRNFLRKGFYIDLVEALQILYLKEYNRTQTDLANHGIENDSPKQDNDKLNRIGACQDFCVADLGCGEGYYLDAIVSLNSALKTDIHKFGSLQDKIKTFSIDISKTAVQRAAVAHAENERMQTQTDSVNDLANKSISHLANTSSSYFAVASNYDVPLFDDSMNVICAIFSPVSDTELGRVLRGNGCFIRVSPGPRHFYQLKERLYKDVTLHKKPESPVGFVLDEERRLSFDLHLKSKSDIENLLLMTPLNWHGNMNVKKEIQNESDFFTECDFIIQVFKKETST